MHSTPPHSLTPSILIVDPDEAAQQIVQAAFTSRHYQSHVADDIGAAIWTAADRGTVLDLIVCDTQVDQQSGYEVVQAIRSLPGRGDLPAMFMSASQQPDMLLRRHEGRSAWHIGKPLNIDLLMEMVERSLWMPHLVASHLQTTDSAQPLAAPHAPFAGVTYPSVANLSSFVTG